MDLYFNVYSLLLSTHSSISIVALGIFILFLMLLELTLQRNGLKYIPKFFLPSLDLKPNFHLLPGLQVELLNVTLHKLDLIHFMISL